jgi:hypothetical protein
VISKGAKIDIVIRYLRLLAIKFELNENYKKLDLVGN